MANEVRFSGTLTFVSGSVRATLSGSGNASPAADPIHYQEGLQDIADVEEQITKGDIGTIGWSGFRNTDATAYVELGPAPGVYSVKLKAGEYQGPIYWGTAAIYAKATPGSPPVALEYLLIEA
jgi:hypothetical protein